MSSFTHKNIMFDESVFTIGIKVDGQKYEWTVYDGEDVVQSETNWFDNHLEGLQRSIYLANEAWKLYTADMDN